MDAGRLNPRLAGTRQRQVQDAKKMQQVVTERLNKKGLSMPPYEFLELIGKGAYGRVYKSKNRETQKECAVKIIEVDSQDYHADPEAKDETIKDFVHETKILQTLKDNKAKNVNKIFDAFSVDTQLWIVSEYCPGGSLTTLMRPTNQSGLNEQFIIPIAREVSIALKYVHDAGIVHRDIKCANILVTEDGRIQLCDFGISGILENQVSKRTTIIGTPHWMAPELVTHIGTDFRGVSYGAEIDCWAFGCAVYEMATGQPPNSRVRVDMLGSTINSTPPRLDASKYSEDLCEFATFCLETIPDKRPSATEIMSHPYIVDTNAQYPTNTIGQLIYDFAVWEQGGGQRSSLFNPLGAAGPDDMSSSEIEEDWNFSTTTAFDHRMSRAFDDDFSVPGIGPQMEKSNFDKIVEEHRTKRGAEALNRLFDQTKSPYAYGDDRRDSDLRGSDLPLRDFTDTSKKDRETLIDLDGAIPSFDDLPNLSLIDPPTIRAQRRKVRDSDSETDDAPFQTARRATQDWQMPLGVPEVSISDASDELSPPDDNYKNRRTVEWTFPKMGAADTAAELTPTDVQETARKSTNTLKPGDRDFNRRTQDWKFPSAEEMKVAATTSHHAQSFTTTDAFFEPPRPTLKHAATMPIGGVSPVYTPASPSRLSLIDLDEAMEINIPDFTRPSTSHSATDSAVTDISRGDPFDLEEQLELSIENSRASLHMKTQSEPTGAFLDSKSTKEESLYYGSDLDMAPHNRSSSMNQSDLSDRDHSTSRPPRGPAARYRQRQQPNALQRHMTRQKVPTSEDSTIASSRGGSFDSTGSHAYNLSFGASDEEMRREESKLWNKVKAKHQRQQTSDGNSTIASGASRSDNEGITMRPSARPSRLVGNWRPTTGSDGFIVPYEPDRRTLLPDCPDDVAIREFTRMWFNGLSINTQNAELLEKEYGLPIDDADLEAEFGPRSAWGLKPAMDYDSIRLSEVSTLRGSVDT